MVQLAIMGEADDANMLIHRVMLLPTCQTVKPEISAIQREGPVLAITALISGRLTGRSMTLSDA